MLEKKQTKKIEEILTEIDLEQPAPAEEPMRQYYFMEKARRLVKTQAETLGRPLTFHVTTFGCQMNARDSEKLTGILEQIGYVEEEEENQADFVIYNTCTVRENANQKVYGHLGQLNRVKKKNPHMLIGLCGCMMQEPEVVEKLKKSYRFVDLIFGTHNIFKFAELVATRLESDRMVIDIWKDTDKIVEDLPSERKFSFKSGVNIMFGCNNFCSYCIVPYVRGRERSRASADILREFRQLVAEGYKDITLLGQNVNSYGKGLPEDITFAALLRMLDAVPGDYRIRFMTSHPKDATRELIDTIANSAHISRHLHLPVQSGSNSILAQMNRKYTAEDYLSLIAYAKRRMPEMTYSSDIIVGFPGETEEDFCATEALIREVEYMQLFTFIYSKRTGTAAASMPYPTPHKEKTQRIARVLAIQEQVVAKLGGAMVGKTVRALVEGPGREEGTLTARLDNNMTVDFAGGAPVGEFADVRVTGVRGAMLKGELA